MKLHVAISMPQMTSPVELEEINDVINDIQHHIDKAEPTKYLTHTPDFHIKCIKLSTVTYFFAVNDVTMEVVYFVRIRTGLHIPNLPRPACRQVLVWRSKDHPYGFLTGLANKIFWDVVYGANNCAISDSLQTKEGASFWRYLVKQAFEKGGIKVRVLNTKTNTFKDYDDQIEFIKDDGKIWGNTEWFHDQIIALYQG